MTRFYAKRLYVSMFNIDIKSLGKIYYSIIVD